MPRKLAALFLLGTAFVLAAPNASAEPPAEGKQEAILWREPGDIATRNLYYGSGGAEHQPRGKMAFVAEDRAGSNPKFDVRDSEGTKWTVKMGVEARPETAAAHLLWAVGYYTDEDYFVPSLSVDGLPTHLQRGQNLIGRDGVISNVRLERHLKDEKKAGNWRWRSNPFTGTRKFNGLRVMMALMNSWDLKDENNKVYESEGEGQKIYVVSDLGASFGTTG